jgi:predicted patatin/cPLA2 family phospholipase
MKSFFIMLTACAGSLLLSGCSTMKTRGRVAVPQDLVDQAVISGIPDARRLGDRMPDNIDNILMMSEADVRKNYGGILGKKHAYLALSGGGADGAFGAGLLNGWTASGKRPEFVMVTGISAGAILSPWAFLGSEYDHVARELFTQYETKQVLDVTMLRRDAITDSSQLRQLIYDYLDPTVIERIAAEHRKGRRLLVGTVNIDTLRPITWDMGVIACSDHPDKRGLIADVILASASIPVAFPPVFIDVEVDGTMYQEIHVDGGLGRQVFFYPEAMHWDDILNVIKSDGKPELYVIRNAKLDPEWKEVKATALDLGGRSVSSLIRTQGIGDISKIYLAAERDGLGLNLAYIPEAFDVESDEAFDRDYMQALYDLAYKRITEGDPWLRKLD